MYTLVLQISNTIIGADRIIFLEGNDVVIRRNNSLNFLERLECLISTHGHIRYFMPLEQLHGSTKTLVSDLLAAVV